jgi:hypothetical protein
MAQFNAERVSHTKQGRFRQKRFSPQMVGIEQPKQPRAVRLARKPGATPLSANSSASVTTSLGCTLAWACLGWSAMISSTRQNKSMINSSGDMRIGSLWVVRDRKDHLFACPCQSTTSTTDYVRSAIFRLASFDKAMQSSLETYSPPVGNLPVAQHVWGKLRGKGNTLASNNWPYPYLQWNIDIESTTSDDHGYTYTSEPTFYPMLAEGISGEVEDFQVFSPSFRSKESL